MRKVLFFENAKSNAVKLSYIFIITLLMYGCAGTGNMQASANDEPQKSEAIGDQTIECRRRAVTGSRFKRKICKTKSQWAREDHNKQQTAEGLQRDADRSSSIAVPQVDAMGGMSVGVPR